MPDPQPHHVADLLQRLRLWDDCSGEGFPLSLGDAAVLIRTLHAYEAARKDAERYRWLRGDYIKPNGDLRVARNEDIPSGRKRYLDLSLDDAVDAAIEVK